MAIVQISKIQHRSGNLVDLPQLDEAEFGWASDAKRLYIGKTVPNENIEVLTAYSNISFSQLDGAQGNLNITAATNGQVLTFDGTNWVNRGGATGGTINLGEVSNVKISGGASSYVLSTDGVGNLSWTPKGAIVADIANATQANPGVITTVEPNFFTNGALITFTEVVGMTQLNGNSYYANVLTANTFSLYSDYALSIPVNTTGFTAYVSGGRLVSAVGGAGSTSAGGANTSVQYNNNNILDGSADFTWDFSTNLLTINGNANVGNINASALVSASRLSSNIATGTAPLTVTSTTRVANLNVSYANVSDFNVVTSQTTGTFYPVFVNGSSTSNYALAANSGISVNVATGALSATLLTGTLTTAAQPNITSVGTLTSLSMGGNIIPTANITYDLGNNTNRFRDIYLANSTIYLGAQTISGNTTSVIVSGNLVANITGNISGNITVSGSNTQVLFNDSGNANATAGMTFNKSSNVFTVANTVSATLLTGTLTTASQPNVTSLGTLSSLTVTGNITGGNLLGSHANGTSNVNIPASNGNVNISVGGTANVVVVSTGGANVTGNLGVSANVVPLGIKTDNYYYANGVAISFSGSYSNSNVASYLPTYTGNVAAGNVIVTSYVINSVATGISAAGSVQGDATVISKSINIVSTVNTGQGVRLPTAIAGMTIYITNTSANVLNVYPATGAAINNGATNVAYAQDAGSTLTLLAPTTTQWYTTSATYA